MKHLRVQLDLTIEVGEDQIRVVNATIPASSAVAPRRRSIAPHLCEAQTCEVMTTNRRFCSIQCMARAPRLNRRAALMGREHARPVEGVVCTN